MTLTFREAHRGDLAAVIALLRDDPLGRQREDGDLSLYEDAFAAMQAEGHNHLILGEIAARVVATYQITFISGLSLRASRRANVESVRVASDMRRHGIGAALLTDAERRARAAGCALIQLAMNRSRTKSHAFYLAQGFSASHVGFKKPL